MSIYDDIQRLLHPLRKKIFLLLGRAVLAAINNAGITQRLQVVGLSGETITDVERFQEYGFESHPWEDAQAAILFPNGNRDNGIVVAVHDRRYRPTDLAQGEVAMYTDEDVTTPFRVQLKRGRILFVRAQDFDFDVDGDMTLDVGDDATVIIGGDKTITVSGAITETVPVKLINAATSFKIDSPVAWLGNLAATMRQLVDDRFVSLFNAHKHAGIQSGGEDSGIPTTTMTTGGHCTDKLKGN